MIARRPSPRIAEGTSDAADPARRSLLFAAVALAFAGCRTDPSGPAAASGSTADADAPIDVDDWPAPWAALLADIVTAQRGLVRYDAAAERREQLDHIVQTIARPRRFADDNEQLAFLLNAHNALVIANVLRRRPLQSPGKSAGFFTEDRFDVNARSVTIRRLVDDLILPLGDARLHVALVSGTASSPPLRREPYDAARLDEQLDDQARRFLTDPAHNTLLGGTLMLSPLFREYAPAFEKGPWGGVLGFIRQYAPPDTPLAAVARRDPPPPIAYLDYNWALNFGP